MGLVGNVDSAIISINSFCREHQILGVGLDLFLFTLYCKATIPSQTPDAA